MRSREDPEYATFLENIGNGVCEHISADLNGRPLHARAVRLPEAVGAPFSWAPADLLHWVYGGYERVEPADWCRFYETRAVVTPTNVAAAELNETMLQGLPVTAERIFLSHDSAVADAGEPDHYTPEFMNSLDLNRMPPHQLHVRPGALMMILRNYAPQKGSTLSTMHFP